MRFMKIKVISLERSVDRRTSIQRQFDRLGVAFDFFDAITPARAHNYIHHYDEQEFFLNCGRIATDTEIACYASHLTLWRQCADEGHPFLVLEDDAKLDETFVAGMPVVASEIADLGFIRVSLPAAGTKPVINRHGSFRIRYCSRVPLNALGYALSPRTAANLADTAAIVEEPIDKFLQRFWRHGQPVYAVNPPLVHLSRHADESVIGTRVRPKYGFSGRVSRALRKMQNSISRTAFNVSFAIGAKTPSWKNVWDNPGVTASSPRRT